MLGHTSSASSVWARAQRLITKRSGAFVLAFIVLASLAFRLHLSAECSLWFDEVTTHRHVMRPWGEVLKGPSREHPPLMYVLIRVVLDLFGQSPTLLRSVSIFFGCVLLIAIHELCLELGLSVKRALIVVGSFALTPFFIRHATESRHYAILAAFVVLATTSALRLLRPPWRARDLAGFVGCALAAAATQYFGLAYALALLGALVLGIRPVWQRARAVQRVALLGSLSGLLAVLGWIAIRAAAVGDFYASEDADETAPALKFSSALLSEMLREYSFLGNEYTSWFIQPLLAVVGLALLSWRLRGAARLLPLGLGMAPCIAALFISSGHFLAARYLAPSAVLYHLGSCAALFAASDRIRSLLARRARALFVGPAIGWCSLAAVLAARLSEFPDRFGAGGDDYRSLQRYFRENLAKDTRVVSYVGYFGHVIFDQEYRLGSRSIYLERFQPVSGIDRYLVVELHVGDARRNAFEKLITRKLRISPEAFRALPLVPLPHSRYQPAVNARLVQLPTGYVPPPSGKPRKR